MEESITVLGLTAADKAACLNGTNLWVPIFTD
jgi:hypothetical protein